MEDSGFDSGDRVANFMQNYNSNNVESENSSSEDIVNVSNRIINVKTSNRDSIDDIVFKSSALPNLVPKFNVDNTTTGSHVSTEQQRKSHHLNEHNKKLSNINTCKGLQRKLEQKVEKAKKNFLQNEKINQMENDFETRKSSSTNLIPISRLPFPRNIESQRLVEYKSDNSDEEVASFFPVNKRKLRRKQTKLKEELDTFSIQEMTIIESDSNDGDKSSNEDDDDCDSQLHLELPPRTNESIMDKIRHALCCSKASQGMF